MVDTVDLNRYVGTWYEIASIPVWFQKACDSGSTAEYSLTENGEITVVNRCCTREGNLKEAKGRAWIVDKSCPAKLKVGFFSVLGFFPFKGDYWIIELDPDYRWALIGEPGRTYAWILAREPSLDAATLERLLARAAALGFDREAFVRTQHGGLTR